MTHQEGIEYDAYLLVTNIRSALTNGYKHFDKTGRLLQTELAIITAMVNDQNITIEEP